MGEEAKPVESSPKSEESKTVPLSDLITFKKASLERERKLKEQLVEAKQQANSLQAELKVRSLTTDDDEAVKSVKAFLLEEKVKLDAERTKHDKDVASFREREKEVRVKDLATQYGIEASEIEDEEDIEKAALRLFAMKVTEEKKKEKKSPEPKLYETGSIPVIKKMPRDMNDTEFAQYEKELKAKALSK